MCIQFKLQVRIAWKIKGDTENSIRTKCCNMCQYIVLLYLIMYIYSVCFILYPYSALLNVPTSANDNTAIIVGGLFGGVAIGVVAVLLVQGIVCGVCKLRKWKKELTASTETDSTADNKSVTHSKCMVKCTNHNSL